VIDTNVLLDWLLGRDPIRTEAASALLARNDVLWEVSDAIITELVFVLENYSKFKRLEIVDSVNALLDLPNIVISRQIFRKTLDAYLNSPALSIVDCYLLSAAIIKNKLPVWTFDKKLLEVGGVNARKP
jgi:predicted nucleic acid-binding protein